MKTINVDFGAGEALGKDYSLEAEKRMLADIEMQINTATSPSVAMVLISQKQALANRIRFKQWLQESQALDHVVMASNSNAVELSHRAQMAMGL